MLIYDERGVSAVSGSTLPHAELCEGFLAFSKDKTIF